MQSYTDKLLDEICWATGDTPQVRYVADRVREVRATLERLRKRWEYNPMPGSIDGIDISQAPGGRGVVVTLRCISHERAELLYTELVERLSEYCVLDLNVALPESMSIEP